VMALVVGLAETGLTWEGCFGVNLQRGSPALIRRELIQKRTGRGIYRQRAPLTNTCQQCEGVMGRRREKRARTRQFDRPKWLSAVVQ